MTQLPGLAESREINKKGWLHWLEGLGDDIDMGGEERVVDSE